MQPRTLRFLGVTDHSIPPRNRLKWDTTIPGIVDPYMDTTTEAAQAAPVLIDITIRLTVRAEVWSAMEADLEACRAEHPDDPPVE